MWYQLLVGKEQEKVKAYVLGKPKLPESLSQKEKDNSKVTTNT